VRVSRKKRTIFPAILLLSLFFLFSPVKAEDSANIPAGELLFQEKCSVCHKTTDQALVGPGLQGIMERRDEKWVDTWLQDPGGLINSGDKTAVELKKGFFRTMPTLPEMKDPVKRKAIIEYLKTLKQEG